MKKEVIIFFVLLIFFSVKNVAGSTVVIDSSKNYQAMDESSSQTKILSDKYGNYYVTFIKRYNGNDQVWVYSSYDEGHTWTPLSISGAINVVKGYDQKQPSLAIDNKNGILYAFWCGADENHTGEFWFDKYNKYQPGDTQIKFAYYKNGQWSEWKNIAEVSGYNDWVNSSLLNDTVYSYNPVIGGKLKVVKYYQVYPTAAVDSSGNVYVVWSGPDKNFTGYQIKFSKSSDFGKTWSGWKNITTVSDEKFVTLEGTTNMMFFAQMRPKILVDKNDRIWVFYEGQDSSLQFGTSKKFYQKIRYMYSDDKGETFTNPAALSGDAKIEKYVDVVEDSTGKLHIVWSGQLSGDSVDNMRQIRYAVESGGTITAKNYYIAETSTYEQKNPTITLDKNDIPIVYWAGNDNTYQVYEDGDPVTLNINVLSNWTGMYIMRSKYNYLNDSWSSYRVLGKGYQPAVLKSLNSETSVISYLFAAGADDFQLRVTLDDYYINDGYVKNEFTYERIENLYVYPNPISFKDNLNVVVRYEVIQDNSEVEVGIINLEGKKIAVLVSGNRDKGVHQFYWNGRLGIYSGSTGNVIGNLSEPVLTRGIYLIYYKINGEKKIIKKLFVR